MKVVPWERVGKFLVGYTVLQVWECLIGILRPIHQLGLSESKEEIPFIVKVNVSKMD